MKLDRVMPDGTVLRWERLDARGRRETRASHGWVPYRQAGKCYLIHCDRYTRGRSCVIHFPAVVS